MQYCNYYHTELSAVAFCKSYDFIGCWGCLFRRSKFEKSCVIQTNKHSLTVSTEKCRTKTRFSTKYYVGGVGVEMALNKRIAVNTADKPARTLHHQLRKSLDKGSSEQIWSKGLIFLFFNSMFHTHSVRISNFRDPTYPNKDVLCIRAEIQD